MKRNSTTAKNAAQVAALITMAGISIICLITIPADNNPMWFLSLFGTKAIAAAGFYAAHRLYEAWKGRNKWLAAYDRFCMKVMEAPNPMHIGEEEQR